MKAAKEEKKKEFIPVIVTLETQEEVDKLYIMCNNGKIATALEIGYEAGPSWWKHLMPFTSDGVGKWAEELRKAL